MPKYLYIPMEIFDREIDGNLLLATKAVQRGWHVVLGGKRDILPQISNLNPGVFLLKSIVPGEVKFQDEIRSMGGVVACLDQEGLLQRYGKEYRIRFSEESISKADMLFFWGREQRDKLVELFGEDWPCEFVVSGSPRADYWGIAGQNKSVLLGTTGPGGKRYPSGHILFATSFGNANHALGRFGQKNLHKATTNFAGIDDKERKALAENAEELTEIATLLLSIYTKIVIETAIANPELSVVVRPHPSEGLDYWRNATAGYKNIEIRTDGPTTDWIIGAQCVVQFSSSVALESALMNVPVISCIPDLPEHLKGLNLERPERVSNVAKTVEGTVEMINNIITGQVLPKSVDMSVFDDITNFDQGFVAADKILEKLEPLAIETAKLRRVDLATSVNLSSSISELKQNLVAFLLKVPLMSKLINERHHHLKNRNQYKRRKTYRLSPEILLSKLAQMESLTGGAGSNFQAKRLHNNMYVVSGKPQKGRAV